MGKKAVCNGCTGNSTPLQGCYRRGFVDRKGISHVCIRQGSCQNLPKHTSGHENSRLVGPGMK
jgi:hypothetical protein